MFIKTANLAVTEVYKDQQDFTARRANRKIVEFDPEFVYVAVRALTADKPNSNGDCFPHEELIRIDSMLNRPVYASFISKGVYVNHKNTDDPRYAKGAVLDARYTKDASGDRYVELLLGVDRQKDPVFAKDVERGIINKFSMGASVQFTKCSVCDNTARKREEFCEHIAKYKMRECKDKQGSKKLAYERCFGVTYNEISAVSDPADESAQLLARVATRNRGSSETTAPPVSHGTVAQMNEIKTAVLRLEDMIMNRRPRTRTAATRKTAEPFGAAPGSEGLPGGEMDMGGDPLAPGGEEEAGGDPIVEVLKIVTDLAEGAIPPEQAVEELSGLGVGGGDAGLPPPGEEMGMPEPGGQDMAPMATSKLVQRLLRAVQKQPRSARTRRTAEDEGSTDSGGKPKGQYPEYKVQKDPKQEPHDSMNGERPAADFDKDQKEYSKLWNINAEFVPADSREKSGWRVLDGENPLYFIAGGAAFGKHLDSQWQTFASRAYGTELVAAILEQGIEPVMAHVRASKIDSGSAKVADGGSKEPKEADKSTDGAINLAKLAEAAEKKASDLADERVEDFVDRFVEGLRVAAKLQAKNVIDNPVKAAAWEVLTSVGLDGNLAEKVAEYGIMETQLEVLVKKALEYTEVSDETFAEIKAHADSMPHTKVAANGQPEDEDAESEAIRMAMRRRAARPAVRTSRQGLPQEGLTKTASAEGDEDGGALRRAIRGNSTPVVRPPTRGDRR